MAQAYTIALGGIPEKETLIFDNPENLPRHYRWPVTVPPPPDLVSCSMAGLKDLRASGSAQFSRKELEYALKASVHNITVVDLRQECHGFLYCFEQPEGIPISWYGDKDWSNVGKELDWIVAEEVRRLKLFTNTTVTVYLVKIGQDGNIKSKEGVKLKAKEALPESTVVTRDLSFRYHRIPVTDHCPPAVEAVDSFIRLVRDLGENDWLHFHCHGGDGRTTSFLSMYDMIRNTKVEFDDIIARQAVLGPENLAKIPPKSSWKSRCAEQRYHYLKCFHMYARTGYGRGETFETWLEHDPLCRKTVGDCTGLVVPGNG